MELIVSINNKNVIGNNGKLLWYIPDDLKHFYNITNNQIVVMGRKTYESLPENCRPLKNRINIILTNQINKYISSVDKNLYFVDIYTIKPLIQHFKSICNKRIIIIGGKNVYDLFMDDYKVLYVTHIDDDTDGDTSFDIDLNKYVCILTKRKYCAKNNLNYKINKYLSKIII